MFKKLLAVLVLSVAFVGSASATAVPARVLVVERITTSNVNAAIASHTYKIKFGTPADCDTSATALNGVQTILTINGRPVHSYTLANCAPEVQ